MKIAGRAAAKRIELETLGWTLVVLGIAALVLPGPGLLALFAGITLLATQYEWAERRVEPFQRLAIRAARDSVANWTHIAISVAGTLCLQSAGIIWGLQPAMPDWWPLAEQFWLPGGWGTGTSLIISGFIAQFLIVFSYIKFRD